MQLLFLYAPESDLGRFAGEGIPAAAAAGAGEGGQLQVVLRLAVSDVEKLCGGDCLYSGVSGLCLHTGQIMADTSFCQLSQTILKMSTCGNIMSATGA